MLEFEAEGVVAAVEPARGGRVSRLCIGGCDVLVGPDDEHLAWGSYPMVPFAGRVRHGRFSFAGQDHVLPVNMAPHAIHGYGYTSQWDVVADDTITFELAEPWPFAGRVTQRFELRAGSLAMAMTVEADEPQPVVMGWHPWFRRDIGVDAALELTFGPARMYALDAEAIPTGELVDPPDGPWDNCFTELAHEPVLRWGAALELRMRSSADHWVIYDQPAHAICVEPQTAAPDAFNRPNPPIVEPATPLTLELRIEW